MRRQVALLWVLASLSGCDDEQPCSTSAQCESATEVCLPATLTGATASLASKYCGRVDDRCDTGLRWSASAGQGLAGACVTFASADAGRDAAPGDARVARDAIDAPPDLGNSCGPDGAECAPTTDPCKLPGRCAAGVCGPITSAPDGTKCGNASNACHTDRLCKSGQCQAEGTHADGHNYDSGNYLARCCAGTPTSINTPNNCGACGLKCASGRCINTGATNNQQWWCSCTASSECWSGCCADGSPSVCSPSSCGSTARCIACPGGASCTASQTPHYWCHY